MTGTFKIGTHTLEYSGTLAGVVSADGSGGSGPSSGYSSITGNVSTPLGGCALSASVTKNFANGVLSGGGSGLTAICNTAWGNGAGADNPTDSVGHVFPIDPVTVDPSDGEWSVSCPCDIMLILTGNDEPFLDDGTHPFRFKIPDGGVETWATIQLWAQPDVDVTFLFSIGGLNCSAIGNTGGGGLISPGAELYVDFEGFGQAFGDGTTGSSACSVAATCSSSLGGSSVAGVDATASATGVTSSALDDPGTVSASGSGTGTSAGFPAGSQQVDYFANAFRQEMPDRGVSLSGVVRAMEDPYPDELEILYEGLGIASDTASDTFGASYDQKWARTSDTGIGGVGASVSGSGGSDSDSDGHLTDTYGPVSAWMSSAGLAAIGEDPLAKRITLRGLAWDAMTITQAGSVTVDDGTDLTPSGDWEGEWDGSGDVSPSIVSGAVQFDSAGGAGTLSRDFTNAVSLSGYRYLRVRVRSVGSANQPLTMDIGGKEWPLTTDADGTWKDVDIDLCGENGTGTVSTHDTHWPEELEPTGTVGSRGDELPQGEGTYFGVGKCAAIVFEDLAAGVTYEIDSLTLRRDAYSRVTLLQTLGWWTEEYPADEVSGTLTTYHETSRFLTGDTDGRQSLELAALRLQRNESDISGTITTYYPLSILALIEKVNDVNDFGKILNPGWVATDLEPGPGGSPPDRPDFFNWAANSGAEAAFLGGGGAYFGGASWSYYFDISANGTLTLPAQLLFDKVLDWPGGIGDVFNLGGSGGTLTLVGAIILRGQAHGLVYDEDKAPSAGVSVEVRDSGDAFRGDGSSGSDGAYQTGLDYAKPPGNSHTVQAIGGANPAGSVGFYGRKRHRVVLVVGEAGDILSVDTSPTGRTSYAGVQGGTVMVHHSLNWQTNTWSDINTGIAGEGACLRYEWGQHRIWLSYLDGTDVKRVYSDDGGESWSSPASIASGASQQGFGVFPTNWQLFAWRDAGAIKVRGFDSQGTALWSVVTAVASGADDAGVSVLWSASQQKWYILYSDSGNVKWVSADADAQSWISPVSISSGASQQAFAGFPTGWLSPIWLDGDELFAQGFDREGNDLWSPVSAVASGVDDAGIGITYDSSAQRWYILYRESGTVKRVESADGGLTWS